MKLVSEVNWSTSSNICLICSRSSLRRLKDINKNAISTRWIIAKVSQKLYHDFIALGRTRHVGPVCLILSAVGRFIENLVTRRWKTFCYTKLNSTRFPQSHPRLNGFFLTVSIVAVSFLRISFTIIWACMEAGRRNKPSIGIKALPIFWSSGQRQ